MDMHSMTYILTIAIIAIVVLGIGYVLARLYAARAVASDHTGDPNATRSDDFGAADRARAVEAADHEDPRRLEDTGQGGDPTE